MLVLSNLFLTLSHGNMPPQTPVQPLRSSANSVRLTVLLATGKHALSVCIDRFETSIQLATCLVLNACLHSKGNAGRDIR